MNYLEERLKLVGPTKKKKIVGLNQGEAVNQQESEILSSLETKVAELVPVRQRTSIQELLDLWDSRHTEAILVKYRCISKFEVGSDGSRGLYRLVGYV